MPYVRNQSGQVLYFYAYDANGNPVTGDAANMTGMISLDGGTWTSLANTITEDAYGWYRVTLSQAETDAGMARVRIVSSTAGVRVNPIVIHYTTLTETRTGYLDTSVSSRASQASVDSLADVAAAILQAVQAINSLTANDVIRAMWSKFTYDKATNQYVVYDLEGNVLVTGTIRRTSEGAERVPD